MEAGKCRNCGESLIPGGTFCPACGFAQFTNPAASPRAARFYGPPAPRQEPNLSGGPDAHPVLTIVFAIACVLLVGLLVLLLSFARVTITPPNRGLPPISAEFVVGPATLGKCLFGNTFAMNGCDAIHFEYVINIQKSNVSSGEVAFEVNTDAGVVAGLAAGLGFSMLNAAGGVLVQFPVHDGYMGMNSSAWNYGTGRRVRRPFLVSDVIILDAGTNNPLGEGLTFVVIGTGPYGGFTPPLSLQ